MHRRKVTSAGIASLALLGLTARAEDWPMMGGRPDRNMVSAENRLPLEWSGGAKA
jgi:hypothetical protein